MALVNFNGVDMPTPTKYSVKHSDLDAADSGRTETGVMTRNRVRQGIARVDLAWSNITADEVLTIMNGVEPEKVTVKYFFGSQHTAQMYAGDKTCDLKSLDSDGTSYWDVSLAMIEY